MLLPTYLPAVRWWFSLQDVLRQWWWFQLIFVKWQVVKDQWLRIVTGKQHTGMGISWRLIKKTNHSRCYWASTCKFVPWQKMFDLLSAIKILRIYIKKCTRQGPNKNLNSSLPFKQYLENNSCPEQVIFCSFKDIVAWSPVHCKN